MDAHDRQRRLVLRFALRTGCALALPAVLVGCDRGKSSPAATAKGGESPAARPPAGDPTVATPAAQASGTVSKAQANYQERPNGNQKCGNCQQFVAETSTCRVVEGRVNPDGWCTFWAAKA